MALSYAYYYAIIDLSTNMCVEVQDTSDYMDPNEFPDYIAIPEFDEELLLKYYHNGRWYYDTSFQNEYIPIWEQ
jgi:hypothetical protein